MTCGSLSEDLGAREEVSYAARCGDTSETDGQTAGGVGTIEIMRGSQQMWFRLPRPLKRQIVEVAARYGETQSSVVVRALTLYLETQLGIMVEVEEKLP